MTTLIIAEKPNAAKMIARALADDKPKTKRSRFGVNYFELKHSGKDIIVAAAVGHLFTLYSDKKGYPVLDPKWKESFAVNKKSTFSKKYLQTLKYLGSKADEFIHSCDFDTEGSVIGYNILRFLCNQKDAKRMKFSTLTKNELIHSFEHPLPHLDFPQIEAGLTRHFLDYYWGISTSRALISSVQKYGKSFHVFSTGRVQGPTLAILAKREEEIATFEPKPYWELQLIASKFDKSIVASHEKGRFWKKEEAQAIVEKVDKNTISVASLKKSETKISPPYPFDLTTLQIEAYRKLGFKPTVTLSVAQELYTRALISYPRTSSQRLPPKIGYRSILNRLAKQAKYAEIASKLASKGVLKPKQGKKTDPAHPAIFPTGVIPKKLSPYETRLYDLIVRRFFAVFGDPAVRETSELKLKVKGETFVASGVKTLEPGWIELYNYVKYLDKPLPPLKKGESLENKGVDIMSKKTQPPKRFTQATIIKEMEKQGLGTKATRAEIIQTLYYRQYIRGVQISMTDLGMSVVKTLKKYSPDVVSVALTRRFEKNMEDIQNGKKSKDKVLEDARDEIRKIADDFRNNEEKIGIALSQSVIDTREKESFLGPCPKCGKPLRLLYSQRKKSRFVGCSGYPKCKNMYPVPKVGRITATKKICEVCGTPIIRIKRKGKRAFEMCLDTSCETKKDWGKK